MVIFENFVDTKTSILWNIYYDTLGSRGNMWFWITKISYKNGSKNTYSNFAMEIASQWSDVFLLSTVTDWISFFMQAKTYSIWHMYYKGITNYLLPEYFHFGCGTLSRAEKLWSCKWRKSTGQKQVLRVRPSGRLETNSQPSNRTDRWKLIRTEDTLCGPQ